MPIYSRWTSGYPIGDLVNILLKSDMATRQVCTVQPLGISENAAFVIDVEEVDLQDLKADDTGLWHPTGTKKSYFRFSQSGMLRICEKCPHNESEYYVLTRRYYIHKSYDKFHRQIADIKGELRHVCMFYPEIFWVGWGGVGWGGGGSEGIHEHVDPITKLHTLQRL